ncbi:type IX secretion system membrane protein PorP/SprF [Fulvivirga sp. M361]|uniref:PorP/SprF family type IX secretion system membrane protein n=1 Tax=Fulvivirga sp. M361 TaxID=2594266 RepID=UPI001179F483|nr:type IX secretion system membrane protein PorP/SprF [Fulvivirga sp. M361]TRX62072.1 type IX secretion system membrane protein PorP/SprF [Fulvivirga sp. M361]
MKTLIPLLTLAIVCCCFSFTRAQDPQFSQFYNAPLYMNPGFTGVTPQQRLIVNHRLQWPNLPQTFATYAFSYEMFIPELQSGFGLMATTDKMGTGGWRTTNFGLLYSYKVRVNKNWVFSPGIYFGYGWQGIDQSKLTLGDELANNQNGTNDGTVFRVENEQYFDFASGALLYNRALWFGVSAYHINTPNISLIGAESRLPIRYNVHGGMRIPLYNGPRTISKVSYLTPSFVYRRQGNTFSQLDLGIQYHIDPIGIGVWYRGVPIPRGFQLLDSKESKIQQDAIVFILSLQFSGFQVGYSYDFTISDLETRVGGAHEISMIYEFVAKPFRRGVKRKNKLIPCPTFNRKEGFWN